MVLYVIFSLNVIHVNGTGHKIAMSISVEKQLSLLISVCTKMIQPVCQVLLKDQFCNTVQHNGEYYVLLCFQAELEWGKPKGIYLKRILPSW